MKFTRSCVSLVWWLLMGSGVVTAAPAPGGRALDLNQVDLEQVDDNWDNSSPQAKVDPDRDMKVKDIMEPSSEYTYASFGKPDPFTMPKSEEFDRTRTPGESFDEMDGPHSKEITITSPLQAFPLK